MSKTKISPEQRARIAENSGYRCGYCLTQEIVIGMPLVVEHIIPEAKGGTSEIEALNLNNEYIVRSRRRWVSIGWHPPLT